MPVPFDKGWLMGGTIKSMKMSSDHYARDTIMLNINKQLCWKPDKPPMTISVLSRLWICRSYKRAKCSSLTRSTQVSEQGFFILSNQFMLCGTFFQLLSVRGVKGRKVVELRKWMEHQSQQQCDDMTRSPSRRKRAPSHFYQNAAQCRDERNS
jgi:hypothetical protein